MSDKASDTIRLFEYALAFGKRGEPKEDKPRRRKPKKEKSIDDLSVSDILNMLAERERENEILSKFLKDKEKLNKKEEKKEEEKKGLSTAHLAFFLMLTFPITAPLYVYVVKMMLHF